MFVFIIHITFRFTCQLKVDAYQLPQEIKCMYGSHVRSFGQPGNPVRSLVALAVCTGVRALEVQLYVPRKYMVVVVNHFHP